MTALEKKGILTLQWPVSAGVVASWDDWEKIVHNCFYNELRRAPEEHPTAVISASDISITQRQKKCQIFFETFSVPAYYEIPSSVACIAAMSSLTEGGGSLTGLSVEAGSSGTLICPVVNGRVYSKGICRNNYGGKAISEYLASKLGLNSDESEFVKKQACFVSQDFDFDKKQAGFNPSDYNKAVTLPSGQAKTLCSDRFEATEPLFANKGIGRLAVESLSHLSSDGTAQAQAYRNVVVSGGTSLLKGFAKRLETEIVRNAPQDILVNVKAPKDRQKLEVIGGQYIITHVAESFWFSKENYDEKGPSGILSHCNWF